MGQTHAGATSLERTHIRVGEHGHGPSDELDPAPRRVVDAVHRAAMARTAVLEREPGVDRCDSDRRRGTDSTRNLPAGSPSTPALARAAPYASSACVGASKAEMKRTVFSVTNAYASRMFCSIDSRPLSTSAGPNVPWFSM